MIITYQSRIKALMIDDDPDVLSQVRRILRSLDVELITTDNREDFLALIKEVNPRFCLIDLNIAGTADGLSLIKEIRSSFIENTTLFVVSSSFDMRVVDQALSMGATDYFMKPIDRAVVEKKMFYYFKNEISSSSANLYVPPGDEHQALQIQFASQLVSVDEFGIQFMLPHLLPKGTYVKISGPLIENITGQSKIMTSILSSSLDSKIKLYVYYAEFEDASEESLQNVRKWLMAKISS